MVPATCWHVAPLKYGNGIRILTRGRSIEHRNLLLPTADSEARLDCWCAVLGSAGHIAMFANGCDGLDRTFEAIEGMPRARGNQLETLVIVISTNFASCHKELLHI
jgi:hypothetical protein